MSIGLKTYISLGHIIIRLSSHSIGTSLEPEITIRVIWLDQFSSKIQVCF